MHIQVVCGILEDYKPSEKTKEIFEKIENLKKELEKFKTEVVFPVLTEIQNSIDEENGKFISKEAENKKQEE